MFMDKCLCVFVIMLVPVFLREHLGSSSPGSGMEPLPHQSQLPPSPALLAMQILSGNHFVDFLISSSGRSCQSSSTSVPGLASMFSVPIKSCPLAGGRVQENVLAVEGL